MTIFKAKAVEGSGMGPLPEQPWEPVDSGAMQTVGARSLDGIAAKFEDRDYSVVEAKALIRRVTRTRSYDHASVDAVFTSLLSLGALRSVVWKLGPQVVRPGDLSTPRTRRKATRVQYEQCLNETGDWIAVPRDEASAFRRRVALFNLDLQDRDAERLAEQRRLLRAQVEADARS
jgi:hypothetical protein